MKKMDKIDLLVQTARLYYELDYSQQMIAERLNISRPYVSKLINQAKLTGIVEIKINDPNETESSLEKRLRQTFDLQRVFVIPTLNGMGGITLEKLANVAAKFLNNIISDNDIIGVVWGDTLYECSKRVISRNDLHGVTVVQLCGGMSKIDRNIFASHISKNFADALNGTPYTLPLPAIVDSEDVKNAILKDRNISDVLNLGKQANTAIITIGAFGAQNALYRAGYLNDEEVESLIKKGAVGDIFSRIINIDGEVCDKDLDRRTIAIELDDFKKIENRIAVVSGIERAKCLCGALRGGYCNVLITEETTATEVLRLCECGD